MKILLTSGFYFLFSIVHQMLLLHSSDQSSLLLCLSCQTAGSGNRQTRQLLKWSCRRVSELSIHQSTSEVVHLSSCQVQLSSWVSSSPRVANPSSPRRQVSWASLSCLLPNSGTVRQSNETDKSSSEVELLRSKSSRHLKFLYVLSSRSSSHQAIKSATSQSSSLLYLLPNSGTVR